MTFRLNSTSANSGAYQAFTVSGSGRLPETIEGLPVVLMPTMISRAQAYYWSNRWQHDEAESLVDLEAGSTETFHNGRDAVRWLLSADDD